MCGETGWMIYPKLKSRCLDARIVHAADIVFRIDTAYNKLIAVPSHNKQILGLEMHLDIIRYGVPA